MIKISKKEDTNRPKDNYPIMDEQIWNSLVKLFPLMSMQNVTIMIFCMYLSYPADYNSWHVRSLHASDNWHGSDWRQQEDHQDKIHNQKKETWERINKSIKNQKSIAGSIRVIHFYISGFCLVYFRNLNLFVDWWPFPTWTQKYENSKTCTF